MFSYEPMEVHAQIPLFANRMSKPLFENTAQGILASTETLTNLKGIVINSFSENTGLLTAAQDSYQSEPVNPFSHSLSGQHSWFV